MKRRVIKWNQLPSRPPVVWTVVVLLAADHWQVPDWARYVMYTLIVVVWIGFVISVRDEVEVRLMELEDPVRWKQFVLNALSGRPFYRGE